MTAHYSQLKAGGTFVAAGIAKVAYKICWFNPTITAIMKLGTKVETLLPTQTVLKLISDDPKYKG